MGFPRASLAWIDLVAALLNAVVWGSRWVWQAGPGLVMAVVGLSVGSRCKHLSMDEVASVEDPLSTIRPSPGDGSEPVGVLAMATFGEAISSN